MGVIVSKFCVTKAIVFTTKSVQWQVPKMAMCPCMFIISDNNLCDMCVFTYLFSMFLQSKIVLAVSMERLTAVFVPLKVKVIFTKGRATIGLVVKGMIFAAYNVSHLVHRIAYTVNIDGVEVT